jgi:hypothetical protein
VTTLKTLTGKCLIFKRLLNYVFWKVIQVLLPLATFCVYKHIFCRVRYFHSNYIGSNNKFKPLKQAKSLVKVTTGQNSCKFHQHFTSRFFKRKFLQSFSVLTVCGCIYCRVNIGKKAAHKKFVILTTGVDFINVLCGRFSYERSFFYKT